MTDSLLKTVVPENPDLPVFPAIALQVLQYASQPDCQASEVRRLIELDPLLAARVLRTVNSALYGLPRSVGSIERAVALLGTKPLRAIVLGYSLSGLTRERSTSPIDEHFWLQSLTAAAVARELATALGREEQAEDDFAAALVAKIGILVLDRKHPRTYASSWRSIDPGDLPQSRLVELQRFQTTHAEISAQLLERWGLPSELSAPIRYHLDLEEEGIPSEHRDRAQLLHQVFTVASLLEADSPKNPERLIAILKEQLPIEEISLRNLLVSAGEKIQELAELTQCRATNDSITHALGRATLALASLALETSVASARSEEEIKAARAETTRWRRTAYRFRRQSTRDPLTNLCNRSHFEESLVVEFKRAARRAAILGLLFIDLDSFKQINDRFGHPFGDRVLQAVASRIRQSVRRGDIVARYGGDEFVVIVSDSDLPGIQELAHRLQTEVSSLVVEHGPARTQVGASVGAVGALPHRAGSSYEKFLSAADQAMYAAKNEGKNKIHFVSLLTDDEESLLDAVRKLLFSRFLEQGREIDREQIRAAAGDATGNAFFIGRLARKLGWITPRGLRRILHEQRKSHELFGEVALRLQILRPRELHALLAIQQENPEELTEALLAEGVIDKARAEKMLREYYEFLRQGTRAPRRSLARTLFS